MIYRSDFTKPTGWDEERSDFVYVFIRDGWYHIAFRRPQEHNTYYAFYHPPIILDAFRAQVDVERYITSGDTVDCGVIFCSQKENGKYCFELYSTVSPNGYYRIHLERENEGTHIVDWQKSEFVKKGNDAKNTLMVQRTRENITLGINGHILARETVSGLTPGHVGLFVRAYKEDAYAEARFRNFLIYAIDK